MVDLGDMFGDMYSHKPMTIDFATSESIYNVRTSGITSTEASQFTSAVYDFIWSIHIMHTLENLLTNGSNSVTAPSAVLAANELAYIADSMELDIDAVWNSDSDGFVEVLNWFDSRYPLQSIRAQFPFDAMPRNSEVIDVTLSGVVDNASISINGHWYSHNPDAIGSVNFTWKGKDSLTFHTCTIYDDVVRSFIHTHYVNKAVSTVRLRYNG